MVVGLNRVSLVLTGSLLLFACSSDENGVLNPDGSITPLDAAGTGGSATTDGSVEEVGATDGPTTDAPATDAVTDTVTAVSDVLADGMLCNALVNSATVVTPTVGVGAAPALTGGTITPGTYVETKVELFGADGGVPPPEQSTIALAAATFDEVVKVGTAETRLHSTYTVMMTTITIVTTCDSTFKFTGMYSAAYQASPTTFIYSFDSNGGKQVKTYTKM